MRSFLELAQHPKLIVKISWVQLFIRYVALCSQYEKKVVVIGAQILGALSNPIVCDLLMDIVELAITLKKCEQIKTILKSNLTFANIQEFKELLDLQLQKE